jgi:ABC-type branched-subunit amino acid transport system substrate-binding protein
MRYIRRTYGVVAIGIGAAIALSACGSSGSSGSAKPAPSGTTGTPAGAGAGSSDSAISAKVLVVGDFTSAIPYTVPEVVPTVKGVLRGFPGVTVESCDSKGTAAGFQQCSEKGAREHVAAVIQGYSALATDQTLLTKADIPVLDSTNTTSANAFPVTSPYATYAALGVGLEKAGCTKLGTLYLDAPGSSGLVDYIKQGIESQGGAEVARAPVANNAADLSPAVAKLTGAGAQCIAVSLAPTGAAQALTAIKQSGKKVLIGGGSGTFSQQLIDSLGALSDGLLLVDSQLNPVDTGAGIRQVVADETAENAKAPLTTAAISAWVAARLVAAALPKVQGAVTPASMMTALNGLRNVDMDGVIEPWSSTQLSNPLFTRLFNHSALTFTVTNGKPVRQGNFYDLTPILDAKK